MSKTQRAWIQLGLVVGILAIAVIIAKTMVSLRKPPEKKPQAISAPLLNAQVVSSQNLQMTIQGYGTVEPRVDVQVVPQVSGKVIQCNPQFVNGGFFKTNEPLVMIEQTDYQLAVESAEAAVAQAEVQLEKEKAEADVAKKEWEKLRPGQQPDSVLVFRGPQIQSAQAQLNAARAQLAKAKLDLERTTIQMPFDGRVVSTNVDLGQFVTAGAPIATVYRTDLVEVVVPLEDSELAWFDMPLNGNTNNHSNAAAKVDVYSNFAGKQHHWKGQLVRTEGQIDPKSRMVHVVAQVDDPFEVEDGQPPLVPGMFVHVDIQGKEVQNIYRIPRYAIHKGSEVWVAVKRENPGSNEETANPQGSTFRTLKIRPVEVIRMDKNFAYVSKGLSDDDIIVTSPLETVTNGMLIRIHLQEQSES